MLVFTSSRFRWLVASAACLAITSCNFANRNIKYCNEIEDSSFSINFDDRLITFSDGSTNDQVFRIVPCSFNPQNCFSSIIDFVNPFAVNPETHPNYKSHKLSDGKIDLQLKYMAKYTSYSIGRKQDFPNQFDTLESGIWKSYKRC